MTDVRALPLPSSLLLVLLPVLVACGPGGGGGTTGGADATDDVDGSAEPTRSYLLGTKTEGYDISKSSPVGIDLAAAEDEERTEALVVPVDLLGVPWQSFTGEGNEPASLPGTWLSALHDLRDDAQGTGKPLVLAMSPMNRTFDNLAPEAVEEAGALVLRPNWLPGSQNYCFNPTAQSNPTKWRDAYAGYVDYVVSQFDTPFAVVLAQRVNLYEENCGHEPGAYEAVVGYARAAHARLSEEGTPPPTIVTVDVEDLYGFPVQPGRCPGFTPAECFAERSALLDALGAAGDADRPDVLGLESYPAVAVPSLEGGTIPADWLSRVVDARPDMDAVIAGTSLPGLTIAAPVGVCQDLLVSDEVTQRAWLDQVLALAGTEEMTLVVWHPLRDLLAADVVSTCPCFGDGDTCDHLDWLNPDNANAVWLLTSAGLWATDDTERLAGTLWMDVLAPEVEGDATD